MGRDIEALAKRLRKRGFVLIRRTRHGYLFLTPNGHTQLIPSTPSDKRSLRNLNGQMKRKER